MTSPNDTAQQICNSASSDKDVALAAMQNELQAVTANQGEDFDSAIRHGQIASALWGHLATSPTATDSQRLAARLSQAGTATCLGSCQWKSGDVVAAKETFESAKNALAAMSEAVHAPVRPKGLKRFFTSPEPDPENISLWKKTSVAILMNEGVMYRNENDYSTALTRYSSAETLLFDQYVKRIGPDEDMEATGKVINLWENIMACALDINDPDRAAQVTMNTMKLMSYWPAHGKEIPDIVAEAVSAFLGAVDELRPDRREALNKSLPEGMGNSLDSLISG